MKRFTRLRTKLMSLGYPVADSFDPTDLKQVRNLLVWLEDRVIRLYSPEKRLRDVESREWISYLKEYLDSLKCPFTEADPAALCDWLLGKALLLEYKPEEDSCPLSPDVAVSNGSHAECGEIFNHIDVNGLEFKQYVTKLARLLQIPAHPDPLMVFKAACILIDQKLSTENIDRALKEYGTIKIDNLKISDVCLGFDVPDPEVRTAAVGLRLLNVNEMRRLQNQANAAVVQVQKLTADPRTDEKLGKVGF
ncbi:Carnitine deficiency associated protein [Paragonimus heterotremus]|uniref:Carnitine deficiency associated protein n=1 Tax=Paragonimus heterotremus TaxID=100268 RepID=A0A8J4T447_9TREM|nr:Carnitine deficiency associated protein [Paragonimus heterotremus]